MKRLRLAAIAALVTALLALSAHARIAPVGAEVVLDLDGGSVPEVAARPDGGFQVVWRGSGGEVRTRAYDRDGAPAGERHELQADDGNRPRVEVKPTGAGILVWYDGVANRTAGRLLDAAGTPVGAGFFVNPARTSSRSTAPNGSSIAPLGNGWAVAMASSSFSSGRVYARRLNVNGARLGAELVADAERSTQGPRLAVGLDERLVFAWGAASSEGTDDSGTGARLRLLTADGAPIGTEMQLNGYTTFDQDEVALTRLSDGNFLVTWRSEGTGDSSEVQDLDRGSIQARYLGASGAPLGAAEFQVNTATAYDQRGPDVAAGRDGGAVISWTTGFAPLPDDPVIVSALDAGGSPIGAEIEIGRAENAEPARIAANDQGEVLVVWEGDDGLVRARRVAVGAPIFVDGFGSGDLSRWSLAEPSGRALVRPSVRRVRSDLPTNP